MIDNGEQFTLDDLQNGMYIFQRADGFRFGIDAVLLSGFARVRPQDTVLDLGSGTGILSLLLAAKTKGAAFTGLEYFEENTELAEKNIAYNHLEDRCKAVTGDIKEAGNVFAHNSFDVIVTNPPYMESKDGAHSPDPKKAAARHEIFADLEDLLREASLVLKSSGHFYMIHRPYRLAQVISKMTQHHLEPKRLRMIQPFEGKEPTMFLIEAVKGASPGLIVDPPLIVYRAVGEYTEEVKLIYGISARE